MAFTFQGGAKNQASSNERKVFKITVGADLLDGATVSSATATVGSSEDPTDNAAVGTAIVVATPVVKVTVLPAEWVATKTYVGVAITLSDSRVIPVRFVQEMIW